jgi:hypothetical protein
MKLADEIDKVVQKVMPINDADAPLRDFALKMFAAGQIDMRDRIVAELDGYYNAPVDTSLAVGIRLVKGTPVRGLP